MRALIISADGFEDRELGTPRERLEHEGVEVDIASLKRGAIRGKHGLCVQANVSIHDVDASAYDLLILPGGRAPAALRRETAVLAAVRHFFATGKPVAAICHGPQILVSAGVMKGRTATCYQSVADELRAAGARYRDDAVVVDGSLITSRQPSDLPAFTRELVRAAKRAA